MKDYQKYIKKLVENGVDFGRSSFMAYVDGEDVFITKVGVDFAKITDEDFFKLKILDNAKKIASEYDERTADIFSIVTSKNKNVLIATKPKFASTVSKLKQEVPPILDDMAQIVGPSLRYADSYGEVLSKLKGNRACVLLPKGYLLATGRSLDEVVTATLVGEKACYCWIKAEQLGGAVPIKNFEAVVMRIIYQKKYSKKNLEAHKEV